MATSLRGREPGSRGSSTVARCQPSRAVKTVTGNTGFCVTVICKVESQVVYEYNKSDYECKPHI
jgi:hypothetical protein